MRGEVTQLMSFSLVSVNYFPIVFILLHILYVARIDYFPTFFYLFN